MLNTLQCDDTGRGCGCDYDYRRTQGWALRMEYLCLQEDENLPFHVPEEKTV